MQKVRPRAFIMGGSIGGLTAELVLRPWPSVESVSSAMPHLPRGRIVERALLRRQRMRGSWVGRWRNKQRSTGRPPKLAGTLTTLRNATCCTRKGIGNRLQFENT
jgi:hypothetical protein